MENKKPLQITREYIKARRNVYVDVTVSDGHSLHRTLFSTIKVGKYMIKSCLK